MSKSSHDELHRTGRAGWLRAAVMGANDGIVSTASLVLGVASAGSSQAAIMTAGLAGLVAGAMSMAAGEYVSVKSQKDIEEADLALEKQALEDSPEDELAELAQIYESRGVDANTAARVALQLMEHDALAAHARDEIGISDALEARPLQAAIASAASFAAGAAAPIAVVAAVPHSRLPWAITTSTLASLALLGALSARAGGAAALRSSLRVTAWGAAAMAATALVGRLFGATIL